MVDEVSEKEQNQISEVDIKRFELIQKKSNKEFRNFESIVKEHGYNNVPLKIANL